MAFLLGILVGFAGTIGLGILAQRRRPRAPVATNNTAERLHNALKALRLISEYGDKQSVAIARRALKADDAADTTPQP